MIRVLSCVAFAALLGAAAAPPEPIVRGRLPDSLRIASFRAGPVRCGASDQVPIRAVAPLAVATALAQAGDPIRFGFRIDQTGRPLSIRQVGGSADAALDIRDLAPALTAWRFAPGAPQADCELSFTVRLDSVEEADESLVFRYAALGRMQFPDGTAGALVPRAFIRLRRPGSTCTPDPVPREPTSLQFQAIPEVQGGMSYSFFSHDVDAQGLPVHIRLLDSSGNRALDVAGDMGLGRARFPAQARSGCLHYFFRNDMGGAPMPDAPPFNVRHQGAGCTEDVAREVSRHFRIRYPVEFIRRPAEGWVSFSVDVAVSGALTNVRILASEPAARFGEEVSRAAAEVRIKDVAGPQHDCLERVRFELPAS